MNRAMSGRQSTWLCSLAPSADTHRLSVTGPIGLAGKEQRRQGPLLSTAHLCVDGLQQRDIGIPTGQRAPDPPRVAGPQGPDFPPTQSEGPTLRVRHLRAVPPEPPEGLA